MKQNTNELSQVEFEIECTPYQALFLGIWETELIRSIEERILAVVMHG
jgi:hypothetical protein